MKKYNLKDYNFDNYGKDKSCLVCHNIITINTYACDNCWNDLPYYITSTSNIPDHISSRQRNYYMAIRIKKYLNEKENT